MPVIKIENDDVRHLTPTTLKYTAALFKHDFTSDFMHFHRIEVALAAYKWQGEKTLFLHNDIRKQMDLSTGNKAILWQKFPTTYFALESLLIKQFNYIFSCHTETAKFYQQKYPNLAEYTKHLKNTVDEEIIEQELLENAKWKLWHGQANEALKKLEILRKQITDQKQKNKLKALQDYLQRNQEYLINYDQCQQLNQTFTSQVAESHIDAVINARHKRDGKMQWSREGAHNMLQIRAAMISQQWQNHWQRAVLPALRVVA